MWLINHTRRNEWWSAAIEILFQFFNFSLPRKNNNNNERKKGSIFFFRYEWYNVSVHADDDDHQKHYMYAAAVVAECWCWKKMKRKKTGAARLKDWYCRNEWINFFFFWLNVEWMAGWMVVRLISKAVKYTHTERRERDVLETFSIFNFETRVEFFRWERYVGVLRVCVGDEIEIEFNFLDFFHPEKKTERYGAETLKKNLLNLNNFFV